MFGTAWLPADSSLIAPACRWRRVFDRDEPQPGGHLRGGDQPAVAGGAAVWRLPAPLPAPLPGRARRHGAGRRGGAAASTPACQPCSAVCCTLRARAAAGQSIRPRLPTRDCCTYTCQPRSAMWCTSLLSNGCGVVGQTMMLPALVADYITRCKACALTQLAAGVHAVAHGADVWHGASGGGAVQQLAQAADAPVRAPGRRLPHVPHHQQRPVLPHQGARSPLLLLLLLPLVVRTQRLVQEGRSRPMQPWSIC